uniref:(northern house mosquito) hypothetical protein n=1 Tax=Culex pipiens TaxID=7175 RepID=A0A8D8FHL1_CULPI
MASFCLLLKSRFLNHAFMACCDFLQLLRPNIPSNSSAWRPNPKKGARFPFALSVTPSYSPAVQIFLSIVSLPLSHSLSTNCQREEKTKQAEWWPAKITLKSIRFFHRQMRPLPAKFQLPSIHQTTIFQMTTIPVQKRRYFTRKNPVPVFLANLAAAHSPPPIMSKSRKKNERNHQNLHQKAHVQSVEKRKVN